MEGDVEMDQLRRRLEETEAAMERIVAQMGLVPHQVSLPPQFVTAISGLLAEVDLEREELARRESQVTYPLHDRHPRGKAGNLKHLKLN
uniref:(California timema) hypothetical protein n=1 Tax=Timema californicum TaxID=61474 RepID=A0A7R9PFV4_TIMCA|nr:unnamed protein product [Timema californicum]